jgi:hypothetical protein
VGTWLVLLGCSETFCGRTCPNAHLTHLYALTAYSAWRMEPDAENTNEMVNVRAKCFSFLRSRTRILHLEVLPISERHQK